MKSVILCEGLDDAWFLGYLIHKWSGKKWEHKIKEKISDKYSLPVVNQNENCAVYLRDADRFAIWNVGGGISRLVNALEVICKINRYFRNDLLENIVIVCDRDQDTVDEMLLQLGQKLKDLNLSVVLNNNSKNTIAYTKENEHYEVYIYPIIIPFNENGALETVLMTAISGVSEEDAYVVEQAKSYVSTVIESGNVSKYLKHLREKVKAEFSSVMSIINPTRSTAKSDELLMLHSWEESKQIKEQFKLLEEIFI